MAEQRLIHVRTDRTFPILTSDDGGKTRRTRLCVKTAQDSKGRIISFTDDGLAWIPGEGSRLVLFPCHEFDEKPAAEPPAAPPAEAQPDLDDSSAVWGQVIDGRGADIIRLWPVGFEDEGGSQLFGSADGKRYVRANNSQSVFVRV